MHSPVQHGQAAGAGGMARLRCQFESALAGSLGVKPGSGGCLWSWMFQPLSLAVASLRAGRGTG